MAIHIGPYKIGKIYLGNTELKKICLGNQEIWTGGPEYVCATCSVAGKIYFETSGSPSPMPSLQYSTDGTNWSSYSFGTQLAVAVGDKVYFKGDNASFSTGQSAYVRFRSTATVSLTGNVMTLIDSTGESLTIPNNYCFYGLFEHSDNVTSFPKLPATTLKPYCYGQMFNGITTQAMFPALPATTLANYCYTNMFYNCDGLVTAPELPASTISDHAYYYMFQGCDNLTTAPYIGATTLESSCMKYMFKSCPSLSSIKIAYTGSFSSTYFGDWVNGVASSGDFYYNGSDTTIGTSAIPTGWTVHTF